MRLSEKAMLVSLNIRSWEAKRTDKKATGELAKLHNVKASKLAVRKESIDTDAPSYKAVKTAMSEMRQLHYELTLPWGRDGSQILTTMLFDDYCTKMRACQDKIKRAVAKFTDDMPRLVSDAKADLNGLFNPLDYPSNIKAKFSCEFFITPIPEADDFRAKLNADEVDDIKKRIRESQDQIIHEAMQAAFQRLYDAIHRMVEKLSDPDGIFRDTLVTNLVDLCQILPGLNLTGDEKLDQLRKRAERMIEDINPQELRDEPKVRRSVAKQAREIESLMGAFMEAPAQEDAA
jgi:hypothetical protein